MPIKDDIGWFKENFGPKIEPALKGTPFTLDLLTAIALQETGMIWRVLRKKNLPLDRILELCVGDSLDRKKTFPRDRAHLESLPKGAQMFAIANAALKDMSKFIPGFEGVAKKPNKFCHGFGIFQYDIQFFKNEPDYFLERRYANFDNCLQRALRELQTARVGLGFGNLNQLNDTQMALISIAYNTGVGGFKASKGLKQGHEEGGRFYGENVFDFLRISKTVSSNGTPPIVTPPAPGTAAVPPPTPVTATGKFFEVDVTSSPLNLRSEPVINKTNVKGRLPDGHIVQAVNDAVVNGFREVETSLLGAHLRGFASAQFLKPAAGVTEVPVVVPAATPPATGIVAVFAPRKDNSITKRTQEANAFSLNEPGQPGRKGTTPDELRKEIATIIDYLAVDKPAHLRYQPHDHKTFCNIYSHDFCTLAGVYLPRVWWSGTAIEKLGQGQTVAPKVNVTVDEQRANDLCRWLRDFGPRFGWRQTGDLTKLQTEANQGAICLIVARRTNDGKPGHINVVVPETGDDKAKRNNAGEVIAPLQSQAGGTNFRRGTFRLNWWKGAEFAEFGFYIHA